MKKLAWITELAVETANEHTLAGLALGVVRDGRLAHFTGPGLADARAARPVAQDTVFRIGSISKTMTAIGVMQLVDEGRLSLDDAVNEHVRGFRIESPAGSPAVTVRHLLTHTGGIGELRRWSDLARPTIGLASKPGRPLPNLADYYAPVLRADVSARTKWAYANHGFAVLGELVANLRGESLPQVMRSRLFEPLGMHGTDFCEASAVARADGCLQALARPEHERPEEGLRLHAADADDPLAFEARHEKLTVPVVFERDAAGRVSAVRSGSTREGFVRLHRRPRAASLRLWARALAGVGMGGVGVTVVRRRRRRR